MTGNVLLTLLYCLFAYVAVMVVIKACRYTTDFKSDNEDARAAANKNLTAVIVMVVSGTIVMKGADDAWSPFLVLAGCAVVGLVIGLFREETKAS